VDRTLQHFATLGSPGSVLLIGIRYECPRPQPRCRFDTECQELQNLRTIVKRGNTDFVQARIVECGLIVQLVDADEKPQLLSDLPPARKMTGWWSS
jgi:hypothetical protein